MKINFKPTTRQIILGAVSLVLFIGALVSVSYIVGTWCVTALAGTATNGCNGAATGPNITNDGTPAAPDLPTPEPQAPQVDLPASWDGASRVNILVMGLDTEVKTDASGNISPDRQGPARSDTMILFTIDPQTH